MSKYYIENGQFHEVSNDELMHYGVKGMRWGVRRATKQLSKATSKEERDQAIAKLKKHRDKAAAKIKKLEQRGVKLAKRADNMVMKTDVEAAKLKRQSAITRNSAYGTFVSRSKAEKRLYKADKLNARAEQLIAKSEQAKREVESNKKMIETFKNGISEIDKALVSSGKKYLG